MDASIGQHETATDETLAQVLGARARRTPADRLVIDIAGGVLVAAAAVWGRPLGWFLLLAAAICFSSYGCWAFAERRLSATAEPLIHERGWRFARGAAAFIGLAAFVTLLFALLGVALGPIKS